VAGRAVAVVLAARQVLGAVELQLLLEGQRVEFTAERKLLVDLVLRNVKVLDIEEADVVDGVLELLDELLLAVGLVKQAEVERDKLGPVDCGVLGGCYQQQYRSRRLTVLLGRSNLLVAFQKTRHDVMCGGSGVW